VADRDRDGGVRLRYAGGAARPYFRAAKGVYAMTTERKPKSSRKVRHVGKGGTIVIPEELRARLGLDEGAAVVLEERDGGLLLLSTEQAQRREAAQQQRAEEEKHFWDEMDAADTRLRADPVAWQEELKERQLWETTLMDGLDPDEVWEESDFVQQ
jgi:AbrB family looped-hinge helix DNA binding protein